jgi:3-oxoacyl-[acyl-carrier protein] reductase
MNDLLLSLAKNPSTNKLIKSLKLPIPLPQPLKRGIGPWDARPLNGVFFLKQLGNGSLTAPVKEIIETSGGTVVLEPGNEKLAGIVIDATELTTPEELTDLYLALAPNLRSINSCGRILFLGRDPDSMEDPIRAGTQAGLRGLTRSLGKEGGARATTAQTLYVVGTPSAARLANPIRFFLSDRSAFITGQVVHLSEAIKESGDLWRQSLTGKRALVTGAAQGIGRAIATRLAEEGAHVVVLDRPEEATSLAQVAQDIGGESLEIDLLGSNAVAGIVSKAGTQGFDIVVNNAGITRDRKLANMKQDAWESTIRINLGVVAELSASLIKSGLNENGRVVCLSSIGGIAGNMGQTNYATAKAGIISLVKQLAIPASKRGITVNAIAPGFIETRMTRSIPLAIREVARRFNSLSQAGLPNDVAEAATFFASPGTFGISGETLRVCGQNLIGA